MPFPATTTVSETDFGTFQFFEKGIPISETFDENK